MSIVVSMTGVLLLVLLTAAALVGPRRLLALAWSGRLPRRVGALPTLTLPADEAPVGFKTAQLLLSPDGRQAAFAGVSVGGSYTADDEAVCVLHRGHDAPTLACECGFYAYQDRARALSLLGRRVGYGGSVVVRVVCDVELSGAVVEHDIGFRGQHQRVLGIRILPWCADCAADGRLVRARGVGTDGRAALPELPWHTDGSRPRDRVHPSVQRLWDWSPLRPVCDACSDRLTLVGGAMDLPALAGRLGTEVSWLPEDVLEPARVIAAHRPRTHTGF